MTKTQRRKTPASAPQPDQLGAIRRLADAGDLDKARQWLAALRKAFPGSSPCSAWRGRSNRWRGSP